MAAPLLRFTEFTDDWEETTLENLAEVERGKFSVRPRNDPRYFGGEMPFVQTGDVAGSGIYLKGYSQTLNADGIKVSKVFPADTILITIAANIGDTTITRYAVACPDSVVAIQSKKDKANTIFLKNLIDLQKEVLDSQATQNAQKNINLQVLKPLELFAPSIEEQTKIASFLSAVDEKISQLTQKNQLLSQYKQGMMQKLFSQQIRFKADDGSEFGEWERTTLGEKGTFLKGKGISKADIIESGILPCIRYGELYTYYGEIISNIISATNLDRDTLVLSKANDVLIPASGETQIDIATASCVLDDDIALSGDLNIYRTKENGIFLSYMIRSSLKMQIAQLAQGNSVVHLYSSQLKGVQLSLPCLEEQTKIANFLSSIDQKIEVVAQQIEQAKTWKKGLLQQMFV
ncbi:restriction endonuclease subunit S [Acinetobacter sp. ANC 4216]|uniref:restriction endonuclease subunit S n=1 Tax=Acinetobacter sp. ANC 4216 TaxID=2529840 RepID=UPI00103FC994|nr:restriction endonuclease subunit S [Acinetobacter sp. ANC 4216]TCB64865.1 restriction endonuclease subunit S [Acinetobacter sp. ANC 4216]